MSRPLDPELVIKTVAEWFRVKPKDLSAHDRSAKIARARHVAMYVLREDGCSLNEIGKLFHRNHTSVMAACSKVVAMTLTDGEFVDDLNHIKKYVDLAHH